MINLIPPDGKKVLRREYMLRVYTVWAGLLSSALLGAAAILIPVYVLLMQQLGSAGADAESLSDEQYKAVEQELMGDRALAIELKNKKASLKDPSEILEHLERAMPADVALRQISISGVGENMKVEAAGLADTRESLRQFLALLKSDPYIQDATVPVADLAQDVEVSFNLTVTLHSK